MRQLQQTLRPGHALPLPGQARKDLEGQREQDILQFLPKVPFAAARGELGQAETPHAVGHHPVPVVMSRPGGPERLASGSDASASPASSSSRLMASMSGASMLAASG
jgi:hypothetical protein